MALFFDPAFDAQMVPIPGVQPQLGSAHTQVRWDPIDPSAHAGTYGDYLLGKVSKVFPELHDGVLR